MLCRAPCLRLRETYQGTEYTGVRYIVCENYRLPYLNYFRPITPLNSPLGNIGETLGDFGIAFRAPRGFWFGFQPHCQSASLHIQCRSVLSYWDLHLSHVRVQSTLLD